VIEHALAFLRMGYNAIPVDSRHKGGAPFPWKPYQSERVTEAQARDWWTQYPRHGIAILTGAISGCIVLDLDRHGDNDGIQAAESLYGWEPEGPLVRTGGGGLHAYYKHPGIHVGNATGIISGVDVRGDGGFVYAPPSIHKSGTEYTWEVELTPPDELPPLPAWVLEAMRNRDAATRAALAEMDPLESALQTGCDEGQRNDTAAKLAGRYCAQGLTPDAVFALLSGWNIRNRPPLTEKELTAIIDSIARREQLKRGTFAEPSSESERAVAIQALGERFNIPLEDIIRIGGDDPIYRFRCAGHSVDVRAVDIGSQWAWRRAIIAVSERVPASIGAKASPGWDHYLQTMLGLARHVEPGEEATARGQLALWLQAYLSVHKPMAEGKASFSPDDPRMHNKRIHVHASSLRKFASVKFDERRLTHASMVQRLSGYGFERATVGVTLPNGKRGTRSMWAVPDDFLDEEGDASDA